MRLLLLIVALSASPRTAPVDAGAKGSTQMTEDERWAARVQKAMKRLAIIEKVLPEAKASGTWDANADTQRFVMRDERGLAMACADYAFLGTYSTASGTWLWAWANQSIPPKESEAARRVKEVGVKEGLTALSEGRVPCSEREALEIAAVAWDVLEVEAPYRFPMTPTSTAFLALFSVRTGADAAKLEPRK